MNDTILDPRFTAPIPTSAALPARFSPPSLLDETGALPVFLVSIATSQDREQLNSRLMELGLTTVTQQQIRASMIETLFEVDWKAEDPSIADNEAHAEGLADFLDGIWQREEVHVLALDRWREQEAERILDEADGAPKRDAEAMPPRLISVRDQAKAQLLADRLMQEPRMRRLAARQLDFSARNAMILARLHIRGVHDLAPGLAVAPEPATNALSEEDVRRLRSALEERFGAALAEKAWLEMISYIDRLYVLDGFEEKNSVSPPGKPSGPSGSSEPSADTATNGGSSEESSSGPARAAGSVTTIDRSSDSISGAGENSTSDSPMAAA